MTNISAPSDPTVASTSVKESTLISSVYTSSDDKLLALLLLHFSSEEQRSFIDDFYWYLTFDPIENFYIDLDDVYECIGFEHNENVRSVIDNNLKEDEHYKIIYVNYRKYDIRGFRRNMAINPGEPPRLAIFMTTNGLKKLCISAATEKATRIHSYYIKMEEIRFEYLAASAEVVIKNNKNSNIIDSPLHLIVNNITDEGIKIRKTGETPPRVSVYDLITVVTESANPRTDMANVAATYPEIVEGFYNFKFPGQCQRPTPVTDARGAVMIINLLPGSKAASFRAKSTDIIVRFLGGDETLIADIRRNAELQANTPPDNPMAIFGQDVAARKEKAMVHLNNLIMPNNIKIISIGIPDALRAPCCVYVIFVGIDPDTGKFVFKFGLTIDFARRFSEHMKAYSCCIIVAVISLGMYSPQCAEDTIKWLLPVQQRITIIKLATGKEVDKVNQETFACDETDVEEVMKDICKEVSRIHAGKVRSVHYGHNVTDAAGTILDPLTLMPVQMLPPSIENEPPLLDVKQPPEGWATQPSLEIEKERTQQRQLDLDKARIELDKARIEAETKTKRFEMMMSMLDKHPEMAQHMDKLITLL